MEHRNKMTWLPNVIFAIGSIALIVGLGCAFYFGMYTHGGEVAAWITAIGGAVIAASMWGFSMLVRAAIRYLNGEQSKGKEQ